jgi:hypothetical protein
LARLRRNRMFPALKKALLPAVLIALFVGSASQFHVQPVHANLAGTTANDGVWFLDAYSPPGATTCAAGNPREIRLFGTGDVSHIDENDGVLVDSTRQDPVVQIASNDDLIICVQPAADDSNVVFTAGGGEWTEARCGTLGTDCVDEEGVASPTLTVIAAGNDLIPIAITYTCETPGVRNITILQDDTDDQFDFVIMCKGPAANISVTATPSGAIESSPAIGNTSHALIRATITDASGNPVLPETEVQFETSRCALSVDNVDTLIEREIALELFHALPLVPPEDLALHTFANTGTIAGRTATTETLEIDTNVPEDGVPNHSEALAILHAEGCDPGAVTITVRVDVDGKTDIEATVSLNIIGPVAFLTVTASPTTLICGEKSLITVSATDAVNQQVSDHTFVELLTNFGGVYGGTGTSIVIDQPVNPLSSTTVELIGGTGRAYLLTSSKHVGPYEALAAAALSPLGDDVYAKTPVTAQVTVTCTKGTPTPVTAPNTGTGASTGSIRPPNTGDAGLAAGSSSDASLFVIAGAVAFVLAGLASFRYARR